MVAKKSGLRLGKADIPIVLGMIARNDRRHDIAAWFGVNQGRIKGAEVGDYGIFDPAPAKDLPPSGPPGIKGRRLRAAAQDALKALKASDPKAARAALEEGAKLYDANED